MKVVLTKIVLLRDWCMTRRSVNVRRYRFGKRAARVAVVLLLAAVAAAGSAMLVRRAWASSDEGAGERKVSEREEIESLIDSALFTRAEFFGAEALVPYPTAEARNRLAALRDKRPNEAAIVLRLSQLDEKLGRYAEAEAEMRAFVSLRGESVEALEELAGFLHRRAEFEEEAATLERMLRVASDEGRAALLERLVRLAKAQKLERYLKPEFFAQTIAENPSSFETVAGYVDRLAEEKNYTAALDALRRYKPHFPARWRYFLDKESSLLVEMGQPREAEKVYRAAFDPFWPEEVSYEFYQFLQEHERFRAYAHELREALRRDPSDYDTAVRLFHFSRENYEERAEIFTRLEKARAARGIVWKPEELATIARLLIKEGDGDTASRFLYTLVALGRMEKGDPLRAKVLYQIFELLSDAGERRLALTRGDLAFYRNVASADPHPGMMGGLLSLVFSDSDPQGEMETEETEAVKHFNRAAAFRIFNAYKQEYPTSPELAQMYLDIVRLYTASGEPQVAGATLAEFEQRYGDAPQYAEAALKLADCYVLAERREEERALYRRILDYLGQHRAPGAPLIPFARQTATDATGQEAAPSSEPTETAPALVAYPPKSNRGIHIPGEVEKSAGYYYSETTQYRDFMSPAGASAAVEKDEREVEGAGEDARNVARVHDASGANRVAYADVLARYVASLAQEKKTADILALYAGEIKKYPEEQGLYEQMLQWLGEANLFDEQLRVYREALGRFPSTVWRDRLARWLLRRERKREFEEFSRELVSQLDDGEAEAYLEKFIASRASANIESSEANLYLGLYHLAHRRFPHNLRFVRGLLKFYREHKRWPEYQKLLAEYYFASREIRDELLAHLSERGELRQRRDDARLQLKARGAAESRAASTDANALNVDASGGVAALPYKLFRADAAVWLSDYEEAIDAYRELNRLYPNTPEYAERLVAFTRSLGQHNRKFLEEAAAVARSQADASPAEPFPRTRVGEIYAELGDYERARAEWQRLISLAPGDSDTYLETATVYWDYFQYKEALDTINTLRRETGNHTLYAFQAGAILEARRRLPEAIVEYVQALDENAPEHWRARRRLAQLFKRPGVPEQITAAYERQRQQTLEIERPSDARRAALTLGYARLLRDAGHDEASSQLLTREVAQSLDHVFIERVYQLFSEEDDRAGQRAALKRLIETAESPRQSISSQLKLAESFNEAGERDSLRRVLAELLRQFPNNYGVLDEAADFYWRAGFTEEALNVLRDATARSRGRFHSPLARKYASRLLTLNRTEAARSVLEQLRREEPRNLGVFRELARLYVRTSDAEALRAAFRETLRVVQAQDADIKQIKFEVADLRRAMTNAFTQLRDYPAAMEQHIEIINRDPEDEASLDAAIAYAKRYGGADSLLAYYQRIAQQAYKNYRWNVVLARIYEAKGDLASAIKSYKDALANQPEMVELHSALAELYARAGDYNSALDALARAAELSNDDPQYLRRTVELLEKSGRTREAELVRRKLPAAEEPKRQTTADLFADAARLRATDRQKAADAYRNAFDAFLSEPFKHELRASEITGYVQAARDGEGLDRIFGRLWELRRKLIRESTREGNETAGRARQTLQALDGALPEAVGRVASEAATGDELTALSRDLKAKLSEALAAPDAHATLALLQNISHRAGLAALEEQLLAARKDAAFSAGDPVAYHTHLRALSDFYMSRGSYARLLELLEGEAARDAAREGFDYAALTADAARLVGDRERELRALRSHYELHNKGDAAPIDPLVERYLEALSDAGEAGREELRRRAQEASPHSLQLANFLLRRGERELAHAVIESINLPALWKLSRHAETSLALGEFDAHAESYFARALRLGTIGELVSGKRETAGEALTGDDWAALAASYGRWLSQMDAPEMRVRAPMWLPASVENRPRDANEQAELGRWYLKRGDARSALEHLTLADEQQPDERQTIASLGSAYFLLGEKTKAREHWAKLVAGDEPDIRDCELFLKTMVEHGLAEEARERLFPSLVNYLKSVESGYGADEKKLEEFKPLVAALAASFAEAKADGSRTQPLAPDTTAFPAPHDGAPLVPGDGVALVPRDGVPVASRDGVPLTPGAEEARAAFFEKLCEAVPDETSLPQLLLDEKLVGESRFGRFYRLLIARADGLQSYDYDYAFTNLMRNTLGTKSLDEALDHANSFRVAEPEGERFKWERKYLEYLLDARQTNEAGNLVASIEKEIAGRYARPAWLRLARVRLELRAGHDREALGELKLFVGSETPEDVAAISAPSVERLNEAVALLRDEHREAETRALLEATYAQFLALEQYELPYFEGLARLAFARGETERGDKLLRLMVKLSGTETRDEAAAEVAALPEVKERADGSARAEVPEPSNDMARSHALKVAAETAAAFGRLEEAVEYRAELFADQPDDYENRAELARLLAASGKPEEAVKHLAATLTDRQAPRAARWQALWLAPEIAGRRAELWAALEDGLRAADAKDAEMQAALRARRLASEGRLREAAAAVAPLASASADPLLKFFGALLEAKNGRAESAAESFAESLASGIEAEAATAFGADEDDARRQMIRLYLAAGRPRAALKLAAADAELVPEEEGEAKGSVEESQEDDEAADAGAGDEESRRLSEALREEPSSSTYGTLQARTRARHEASTTELLGLLSSAAEQTGDMKMALEFERAHLARLKEEGERRAAERRLERLRESHEKEAGAQPPTLKVDSSPVARS